ncbi:sulfate adenylyltransferase subunit CysN [Vibrio albus]|uniref:Sulfate adenylyltransferase subunit 1 n=1 Tax=Vibrio albus TaxID=2200953 RepID=A0A2U3B952_9VIBR|nr:sulfate adenylyltransferase subunit CysN [Vibrio albus]PWI33301.1 sulfate adenylyltransferase subunit CysN [Vibrio albus]
MSYSSNLITRDIETYLTEHQHKDLLRFLTCGSVDDGKSTLIGRLLFDSQHIYDDQMAAIRRDSKKFNTTSDEFDLSLLVDGLQAEREQGITIDVAYRYFSTDKRKFIIADTPGHEQYTRNMATGASHCDLAVVIVDARHGVQLQTRRHSYICHLLGIKHVIVAVNKMDLVNYSQEVYRDIKADYRKMAQSFRFKDLRFVPISALKGDNVVTLSQHMDWYPGSPLMRLLETVKIEQDKNLDQMRFPIQYVNRPNADFRGYCGTLASGILQVGDEVTVLPSYQFAQIQSIYTHNGELSSAVPGQAVTLTLNRNIDVSRGDMLVHRGHEPLLSNTIAAHIVWMGEHPAQTPHEYLFKFVTKTCIGNIDNIKYKVDIDTLEQRSSDAGVLELNDIASVAITLNEKIIVDEYNQLPQTGAFIIIDRYTNSTVAAGMLKHAIDGSSPDQRIYSEEEKELNAYIREHFPEWGCLKIE